MKLHKIDKEHFNEIEELENSVQSAVLFGFKNGNGFFKKKGIFVRIGDEKIHFMPSDATIRTEWIEVEDLMEDDEMTFYWTTVKEYFEWLERTLRLTIETEEERIKKAE